MKTHVLWWPRLADYLVIENDSICIPFSSTHVFYSHSQPWPIFSQDSPMFTTSLNVSSFKILLLSLTIYLANGLTEYFLFTFSFAWFSSTFIAFLPDLLFFLLFFFFFFCKFMDWSMEEKLPSFNYCGCGTLLLLNLFISRLTFSFLYLITYLFLVLDYSWINIKRKAKEYAWHN